MVTLPEGTEMVMPGDNITMEVTLIAPIAMEEKLRFAIREGGRTVGAGVVASRHRLDRIQVAGSPPPVDRRRSVAQSARAPVSKTGGWGFESLHSCQRSTKRAFCVRERPADRFEQVARGLKAASRPFNLGSSVPLEDVRSRSRRRRGRKGNGEDEPVRFLQQVRSEAAKVTWPTRKETMITTAMVFVMVVVASVFFLVVDQVIGWGVRSILGLGG